MATPVESTLVVRFPLLGRETANVEKWSIDSGFTTSTDGFEFTLYDSDPANIRGLELQPVELIVNGVSQLIGRIDKTRCGDNGNAVVFSGRDFMADMLECNVDPTLKIKAGQLLGDAVLLAAGPVGIDLVIDDGSLGDVRSGKKARKGSSGKRKPRKTAKLEDFKPQPGEGIYEFLNKLVARAGATLQPGPNRNTVMICAPTYDQEPLYSLRRSSYDGAANNIISGVADRDYSRFPTYALLNGQAARGGQKSANATHEYDLWSIAAAFRSELGRILSETTVSSRWLPGKPAATEVKQGRLYRLLNHRDEIARDAEQVEMAAKRAVAERLKDTLTYTATVRGHTDPLTGAIFSIDTLVQVDDDVADVHEPLWIAARKLTYEPKDGAMTELTCWRPESFTLG